MGKYGKLTELFEGVFEEQLISRGICTQQYSFNLSPQRATESKMYESNPKSIAELKLKVICNL
jgi:hypothetical protein